ncbi:MAG: hypothetical protein ACTHK0_00535 [Ginsengibacter sp.]
MKKLFFAGGIIVCTLLSCSSSKKLNNELFPKATTGENYFASSNAIPAQEALAMIHGFPKHKYHFLHKKRLLNAWAMFDPADINKVFKDSASTVDSVKFVLASWLNPYEKKPYPTVIMVVYIKPNIEYTFKPVNDGSWTIISVANREVVNVYNATQYIMASKPHYCPPPPDGCTL